MKIEVLDPKTYSLRGTKEIDRKWLKGRGFRVPALTPTGYELIDIEVRSVRRHNKPRLTKVLMTDMPDDMLRRWRGFIPA